MIHISDVSRVTHVVADREAALALYRDVFGAEVFYEGPLAPRPGPVTLLTLADTCIEVVDPFDLGEGPRSFLERYGGFLRSFTFRVDDATAAAAHLRAAGVGIVDESPATAPPTPNTTSARSSSSPTRTSPTTRGATRTSTSEASEAKVPWGRSGCGR